MRLAPALFVLACLAASPALAQTTVPAPADIGPNVDRDFWCATAFGLTSYIAGQAGDPTASGADSVKMQTLFTGIVSQMKAANLEESQFDQLNATYTARVMDPFAAGGDGYAREECETAANEARAFVAAAMAEQAAKEAAAEKPAEPATPSAPAADAPAATPAQ